jgi:polyisoprenoid-binding protein YceI
VWVDTVWDMTVARGRFDRVSGSYQVGPGGAKLELMVDVTSMDTGNGMWDNLLRSTDPLDVAEYPQARFTSTHIRDSGDGTLYSATVTFWSCEPSGLRGLASFAEPGR